MVGIGPFARQRIEATSVFDLLNVVQGCECWAGLGNPGFRLDHPDKGRLYTWGPSA